MCVRSLKAKGRIMDLDAVCVPGRNCEVCTVREESNHAILACGIEC